jgi:hypothetical protein
MRSLMYLIALAALTLTVAAQANTIYIGSATFTSDTEANKTITLPSWDSTQGALYSVTVEWLYSGSCAIGADSDDPFKTSTVNARLIRTWSGTGPGGVAAFGNTTVTSPTVSLGVDNGDGTNLDTAGPDGNDFGTLSFGDIPADFFAPLNPATAPYITAGPGTVNFIADVQTMVNDLQWTNSPDQWQLDVRNPKLTVKVKLTYDGEYIPEPATASLMLVGLGAMVAIRRRRTV